MSTKSIRIRNLARALAIAEEDLLLWLLEVAPELGELHPADFISSEIEARVRTALERGAPPKEPSLPIEQRCTECTAASAPDDVHVVEITDNSACERCGGSVNKREALALIDVFQACGLRRLLVVGGGPGTAEELRALLGKALELRIVNGESYRDASHAEAELAWADVAVIWGSTILPHKVSKLYTDRRADYKDKLITVPRRGAAALCQAVVNKLKG